MPKSELSKSYAFDRPGSYRIRVLGSLDESWSERPRQMNGMIDRS
jgi:hypothetical protein